MTLRIADGRQYGHAEGVIGPVLAAALAASNPGSELGLTAVFSCPRRLDPGRVVCELVLSTPAPKARLVWVDALVVQAPAFIRPLRARIASKALREAGGVQRLAAAFVASEFGRAEVTVRARAVVCFESESDQQAERQAFPNCHALTRQLTAPIRIGH